MVVVLLDAELVDHDEVVAFLVGEVAETARLCRVSPLASRRSLGTPRVSSRWIRHFSSSTSALSARRTVAIT
jgi:hypothetical protein